MRENVDRRWPSTQWMARFLQLNSADSHVKSFGSNDSDLDLWLDSSNDDERCENDRTSHQDHAKMVSSGAKASPSNETVSQQMNVQTNINNNCG